ncbi:MAG TPA: hypothetical protein VIZ61_01690 [Solirubrobacterales bacterium]
MGVLGGMASRFARRSRWLAERLWVVAAIELGWLANRHWRRLARDERRRARELLVKSRGMPSRLSARERREAQALLSKLDYPQFGGRAAGILLPFRPAGRAIEFALNRLERRA